MIARDMLYERLGSLGVNVELIKKLGLSDEELAALEGRLAELVNKNQ
ncbi:MAG: hypothetical protein ABI348_04835 [Nitrososphaera sp.]